VPITVYIVHQNEGHIWRKIPAENRYP